jgi:hypothetical protein
MAHKLFHLYKRPTSKEKKYVYYCRFYDPETGERLPGRSTGQTSKAAAENWAFEQIQKGKVVSHKSINPDFS